MKKRVYKKMKGIPLRVGAVFVVLLLSFPSFAMNELVRGGTYGVISGALVGAASLAFQHQPQRPLRSVAVGASLGLYAGLAFGVYTTYFLQAPSLPFPYQRPISYLPMRWIHFISNYPLAAYPRITPSGTLDGWVLRWQMPI